MLPVICQPQENCCFKKTCCVAMVFAHFQNVKLFRFADQCLEYRWWCLIPIRPIKNSKAPHEISSRRAFAKGESPCLICGGCKVACATQYVRHTLCLGGGQSSRATRVYWDLDYTHMHERVIVGKQQGQEQFISNSRAPWYPAATSAHRSSDYN